MYAELSGTSNKCKIRTGTATVHKIDNYNWCWQYWEGTSGDDTFREEMQNAKYSKWRSWK